MTRPFPEDATADERQDQALALALRDHLAPVRPDADAFAAGVRAAIARPRPQPRPMPGYLRAAAALLPPVVLPAGAASATGAVAAKAGLKLVPAVLALPAAMVVMLVLTAWFALQQAFAGAGGAQDAAPSGAQREISAWWRQHKGAAVMALMLGSTLFVLAPLEAIFLVLLLSTVVMLLVFGRLARAGLATRAEIGVRAGGSLLFASAMSVQIVISAQLHGQAGVWLVCPLLALTGAACGLLSGDRRGRAQLIGAPIVMAFGLLPVLLPMVSVRFGKATADTAQVVAWIENSASAGEAYANARPVADCVAMLEAAGQPRPHLDRYAKELHALLDRQYAANDFNPLYAEAIYRLGLARPTDWDRWYDGYRADHLFDRSPLRDRHDRLPVYVRAARHGLDLGERVLLADRVLAAVADERSYDSLDDLVENAELLEFLGHPDAVSQLQHRTLELLRAHYQETTTRGMAAFAPYTPEEPPERLSFVWLEATITAMRAMIRFGVPDYVDLMALERYLVEMTQYYRSGGLDDRAAAAACALAALRAIPAFAAAAAAEPARHVLDHLADYRLIGAVVLLCLCALLATLRSPRPGQTTANQAPGDQAPGTGTG